MQYLNSQKCAIDIPDVGYVPYTPDFPARSTNAHCPKQNRTCDGHMENFRKAHAVIVDPIIQRTRGNVQPMYSLLEMTHQKNVST